MFSNTAPWIILTIALVFTLSFVWLKLSRQGRQLAVAHESNKLSTQRVEDLEKDLEQQQQSNQTQQQQLADKTIEFEKLKTRFDEAQHLFEEKEKLLTQAQENMRDEFKNLSNEILAANSKKMTEQNKESISNVLNPIREQLSEFRKRMDDVHSEDTKGRAVLETEIKNLKKFNQEVNQAAVDLTNALKGDSKKRGDWGEVILKRVLEESGLEEPREYQLQCSYRNEAGELLRPDAVIYLPDEKAVIIDSKVALNAYHSYYDTADEDKAKKQQAIKEHVKAIKGHIDDLAKKDYHKLKDINSLDTVLMFVPIEPSLMLAFEHDDTLFKYGFDKGIILVSPSTLMMSLKIIVNMWRYEKQNQNIQEIARQTREMYKKLTGFVNSLENVGKHLDKSKEAYDTAINQLTTGRGNVISRAEKISKLGKLDVKRTLPKSLINKATDNEESDEDELNNINA